MAKQQRDQQRDHAVESAKEAAQAAGDVARAKAQTLFETNKAAAMKSATAVAGVLRSASDELEGQQGAVASFARRAADKIEGACRGLESRDMNATLHSLETYARSQSALFLGGAFVAGIAAARFLKASSARRPAGESFASTPFPATRPRDVAPIPVGPGH